MNESHHRIKQLKEQFKSQEAAYLSSGYQESQVRQDFIDKFFAALGWDVTHEIQKNPYEQEVKIENKVNTTGSQRRADYAFFIAPNFRDVKFFVEAKKPSRSLSNPNDYYQTIRYGWNSKTPIAVLTDFEELHILDCRFKPDIKTALDRKLEVFHYSDYEDEEKFKKLFYLLSRNEVANGSIEKYSATLPKPRGKGAKQGMFKTEYKAVDEAFLESLDGYREQLARAFKNKNQKLEGEELTEAVQRTIDRLVFIRFLEDKSIEEPTIVAIKDKPAVWKSFVTLCKRLEPKYNGLVFKPHRVIDSSGFIPPDDKMFAEICDELADPTSPYDFDKIPISILGSIYERFLGKVVSATDKRAKVIEKPEVRKAGGVYYTPEYIVRYIVTETVGKLMYEHASTPSSEKRTQSLSMTDGNGVTLSDPEFIEGESKIDGAIHASTPSSEKRTQSLSMTAGDGVTLSDPEFIEGESKSVISKFKLTPKQVEDLKIIDIACGSGSFLIEVYSQLLDYHTKYYNEFPEKANKGDTETREGKIVLSLKKRQEILTNNIYGVDIDFQATEVTQLSLYLKLLEDVTMNNAFQYSLLKEKILPDLKNNIVCGNSLIGRDILEGNLFDDETEHTLKPMNFEDAFPDIMVRGGFDVVVGNPPYGAALSDVERIYLERRYSLGNTDTACLFMSKSSKLINSLGKVGYIIPKPFLYSSNWDKIRDILIDNLLEIIDCGKVWKEVKLEQVIFIYDKKRKKESYKSGIRSNETLSTNVNIAKNLLKEFGFIVSGVDEKEINIALKIKSTRKSLNDYVSNQRGCMYQKYVSDSGDLYVLGGKQINRYYLVDSIKGKIKRNVIQDEKAFIKKDSILAQRIVAHIMNPIPRIMISATIAENIDKQKYIIVDTINQLENKGIISSKFILGLLNSNLISWYSYRFIFANAIRTMQFDNPTTEKIPFPNISLDTPEDKLKQDKIIKLVEQMLDGKAKLANAKTESETNRFEMLCKTLDRQIDEAVYELYGLSEEEKKIIERGK